MPKTTTENTLQKVINKGGELHLIEKLCFDNIEIISFTLVSRGIVERCMNLEYLTLNSCQLHNLTCFPRLPHLISLQLTQNYLKDKDLIEIKGCQKLSFLSLQQNLLQNILSFVVLSKLPLQILFIERNPLTENENYRQKLFQILTTVSMIDCFDRNGKYAISDDQDSYITDPIPSMNNLESYLSEPKICEEEGSEAIQTPKRISKYRFDDKQIVINRGNKLEKKRKVQFSDDERQDQMMTNFLQKMNGRKNTE